MRNEARKAVIADIFPESARQLANIVEEAGFDVVGIAEDGLAAARLCEQTMANLLLADAVLPVLDGVAAAKWARDICPFFKPSAIILAYDGMSLIPRFPGACVVNKPLTIDTLVSALEATSVERRIAPPNMCARLHGTLDTLGFDSHIGRDYLVDAAFLSTEDMSLLTRLTVDLYPMVARRAGTAAPAVERAMRHAIEKAWSRGDIDEQFRFFGFTIDAARGKPTCGEMIARLTKLVRMEDRQ